MRMLRKTIKHVGFVFVWNKYYGSNDIKHQLDLIVEKTKFGVMLHRKDGSRIHGEEARKKYPRLSILSASNIKTNKASGGSGRAWEKSGWEYCSDRTPKQAKPRSTKENTLLTRLWVLHGCAENGCSRWGGVVFWAPKPENQSRHYPVVAPWRTCSASGRQSDSY